MRFNAWALCTRFVEQMASSAYGGRAQGVTEGDADVDWALIWQAGEGAPSDEVAIGRVVRAALDARRRIASRQPDGFSSSSATQSANGSNSAVVLGATRASIPHWVPDETTTEVPPSAPIADATAVPVEESPPPTTSPPSPQKLVATVMEPSVQPVAAGALVIDARTLKERELPTATVDAVVADERTIVLPSYGDGTEAGGQVQAKRALAAPTTATRFPWFSLFTWMRNVGIIILLFVGWQLWGTSIAQHHAQSQLKSEFDVKGAVAPRGVPRYQGDPYTCRHQSAHCCRWLGHCPHTDSGDWRGPVCRGRDDRI